MLSNEDNEILNQVERGMPMSEMFRCFWLPALLSSDLLLGIVPHADCA